MYTPTQRLMRSRHDKMLGGVAGGIAQYLVVDPVIVRLSFVALGFTGVGLLLYPVLWLIMPQEPVGGAASQDDGREVFVSYGSAVRRPRFDPMTGEPVDPDAEIPVNNLNSEPPPAPPAQQRNRQLGLILLTVGALILLSLTPVGPVLGRFLFPALLIGAGFLLLRRNNGV